MIRYFYKNLRGSQLREQDSYHPGSWVYAEAPTDEEVEELIKKFNLDRGHVDDALDPDEMPRLEREADLTYIFVRYAYTDEKKELTTAPLLFVVGPDLLITISAGQIPRLAKFLDGRLEFATTQRTRLVLLILDQMVDQYEVLINRVGRQIGAVRMRLKGQGIGNKDFIDFVMIEDELNEFLSALQPTTAILRRLLLGRHIALYEQDQDLVEDLLLNNEQSIESCRSHVKSIVNIREAYATISSNNLNRTMKVLTAATVLITLPNVLFGMYGMNISLPFQDHPAAFAWVLALGVLMLLVALFIVRKRLY